MTAIKEILNQPVWKAVSSVKHSPVKPLEQQTPFERIKALATSGVKSPLIFFLVINGTIIFWSFISSYITPKVVQLSELSYQIKSSQQTLNQLRLKQKLFSTFQLKKFLDQPPQKALNINNASHSYLEDYSDDIIQNFEKIAAEINQTSLVTSSVNSLVIQQISFKPASQFVLSDFGLPLTQIPVAVRLTSSYPQLLRFLVKTQQFAPLTAKKLVVVRHDSYKGSNLVDATLDFSAYIPSGFIKPLAEGTY